MAATIAISTRLIAFMSSSPLSFRLAYTELFRSWFVILDSVVTAVVGVA
jgi:hypothetical protein